MQYSEKNKPIICLQENSTCYKNTTTFLPRGVLWHDTGAGNPNISRYVQPLETDANYGQMLALLGKNRYGNDWNHKPRQAGMNCFIGKLADGTVATVQTMPWDFKPWGCGSGTKGSLNNTHLQFEICDDGYESREYFEAVYKEACEVTAYLCALYDLDPLGSFSYQGVEVPVITSHDESYDLGLGSNHGDPTKWLKRYGKSMASVRQDVAALLGQTQPAGISLTLRSLRRGDTGADVQALQKLVGASADGIFGQKTEKATLAFQKQQSLPPTGAVGEGEWRALLGVTA